MFRFPFRRPKPNLPLRVKLSYGKAFEYSRSVGMVVMGPDGIFWCWPLTEHDQDRWLEIEANPYRESKVQNWNPVPEGVLL